MTVTMHPLHTEVYADPPTAIASPNTGNQYGPRKNTPQHTVGPQTGPKKQTLRAEIRV